MAIMVYRKLKTGMGHLSIMVYRKLETGRGASKEGGAEEGGGVRGKMGKGTNRRKGKGMGGVRTRVLPVFVLSLQVGS